MLETKVKPKRKFFKGKTQEEINNIIESSRKSKPNGFVASKAWYGAAILIIMWAVLQEVITASTDIIDNVFVNFMHNDQINGLEELNLKIKELMGLGITGIEQYGAGQIAVNGVTASNQMYIIMFCMISGFCYAAGVYGAQYYGAKDYDKLKQVVAIKLYVTITIGTIFALLALPVITEEVIRFTTGANDSMSIYNLDLNNIDNYSHKYLISVVENEAAKLSNAEGSTYYRTISWSYILLGINITAISSLRETGRPVYSFFTSTIAFSVNCLLNVFLTAPVFLGSFNGLGVQGTALATGLARVFQLAFLVWLMSYKKFEFIPNFDSFSVRKELVKNTVVKALPILLNETLYALGQVLQVKLKAEYSYDALNANAMFETIQMAFFSPLYHGINAGIAVFVGNQLGAGNLDNARYNGKHLVRLSVLIGAVFGLSLVGASFALPGLIFTGSTSNAQHMGSQLMLIYGAIYPIIIINNGCYSILRAGGSFWSSFTMDAVVNWSLQIPLLATLIILNNKGTISLEMWEIHLIVTMCEVVKVFAALTLYFKGRWVRNLVIEKKTEATKEVLVK